MKRRSPKLAFLPHAWLQRGFILFLAGLGLATDEPSPSANPHVFSNLTGATVRAQIVDVEDPNAYLTWDNRGYFKLPINTLVQADQDFIKQWSLDQTKYKNALFDFAISINADKPSTPITEGGLGNSPDGREVLSSSTTSSSWHSGYTVILTNKALTDAKKVKIVYNLFSGGQSASRAFSHVHDTTSLEVTPTQPKTAFETTSVSLKKSTTTVVEKGDADIRNSYVSGFSAVSKTTESATELRGLWLRVYDTDGHLLQEWSSSSDLMDSGPWDDGSPTASVMEKYPPGFAPVSSTNQFIGRGNRTGPAGNRAFGRGTQSGSAPSAGG